MCISSSVKWPLSTPTAARRSIPALCESARSVTELSDMIVLLGLVVIMCLVGELLGSKIGLFEWAEGGWGGGGGGGGGRLLAVGAFFVADSFCSRTLFIFYFHSNYMIVYKCMW